MVGPDDAGGRRRAGGGDPDDVVGVGAGRALDRAGLGHAGAGAQLDRGADTRRGLVGPVVVGVVVDAGAELVEPSEDLGVGAQQAHDEHREQRHDECQQDDQDGHGPSPGWWSVLVSRSAPPGVVTGPRPCGRSAAGWWCPRRC